ncbi:MAG: hypothetical protein HYW71_01300 [Candidatus Niyogibacteria bacterium]|nr:hypothetical protein [Candidatus Niyogibacteria bacterium]
MIKQYKIFNKVNNILKLFFPITFLFFAFFVFAQLNPFDIKFPISELGNCGSMEECKSYCDEPANAKVCFEWAKNKGLAKEPPPQQKDKFERKAEDFLTKNAGPGGCSSFESCDAYCRRPENGEECFRFAKDHGLMPPEELKKIEKEMENRIGPGGCRSRQECDSFCRNPDNSEVCLNFAVKKGDLDQEEADFMMQRMREHEKFSKEMPREREDFKPRGPQPPEINRQKAQQLLEEIGGPGGCKTMKECDVFCGTPGNDDICFNYAIENNLMSPEQAGKMKNMMTVAGPGGCRGRECETFCENPEHGEECLNFAEKQGFMGPQEVKEARKFMELAKKPGPGGCQGREQCDAFCRQPEHNQECMNFAVENGLMPPEEIQRMEQEMKIMKKLEGQGGPGGCRGQQECQQYCADLAHFEECAAFSVNSGMMRPDEAKMRLKEFIDTDERKFERFGPPGAEFGPPPGFEQRPGEGLNQPQERFAPPRGEFGPPQGFNEKFDERFKMFEGHIQEFKERGDYCADPAHSAECRGPMPMPLPSREGSEMMGQPREFGMPPREFPGKPEEFPGSNEFFPPERFREGEMPPTGMTQPQEMMQPREMMPPQGIMPSEGMTQPQIQPIMPPPGMTQPQEMMQPIEMIQPMTPLPTAPSSQIPSSFGILLYPFLELLK